MAASQINMLEGSLTKPLFQFAIPVALIGILQQMFNTADIMVLGRFVGKEALAAVGNNAPVIGVMVNLFLGISLGANVLIARRLGGRRLKEASQAIHTTVLMALLTGLFILVVGEILAGPLMVWMGVPEEVRAASEFYLRIYLLGMPGMTLYDFLSAVYRSHGNVLIPLHMLRHGETVFLDDYTVERLSQELGRPVQVVGLDGFDLADALFAPAESRQDNGRS